MKPKQDSKVTLKTGEMDIIARRKSNAQNMTKTREPRRLIPPSGDQKKRNTST